MYLSKITGSALERYASTENTYKLHQLVWSFFPDRYPGKKRDFLYYLPDNELFIISKERPSLCPVKKFERKTKELKIGLTNGVYFRYILRLNAQSYHDNKKVSVMIARAMRLKEKGKEYDWNRVAYYSTLDWLEERGSKFGFQNMEKAYEVRNFQYCKFKKSLREKAISFYFADVTGILLVTDYELLTEAILTGIGKSKAFGCGMMLLSRYNPSKE